MNTLFRYTINTLYILVILFVVTSLSLSAFIQKQQLEEQYTSTVISGEVMKEEIPVLSEISGSIHAVKIVVGQRVIMGQVLFELTPDTQQTTKSLEDTTVVSPVSGVVEKIIRQSGSSVSMDTPLVVILSDENMKVAVNVTAEQYRELSGQKRVYFYSQRLDQSFAAVPSILSPVEQGNNIAQMYLTQVYTFVNPAETISLLQHEPLQVVTQQKNNNIFALPLLKLAFLNI